MKKQVLISQDVNSLIADRLLLVIGKKSKIEWAREVGVSPSALSNYLSGKRTIPIELLITLSLQGINLNWLLTGKGEMYVKERTGKPESIPEISHLLHEVEGYPELALHLAEIVRGIKESARIEGDLEHMIGKLKKSVTRKPSRRQG